MSYTKHYFVSTIKKGFYNTAIVSSGHAKGALHKFLMHTDPVAGVNGNITKIVDEYGFKKYDINDEYEVEVKRLNIYDDFIDLPLVKVDENK